MLMSWLFLFFGIALELCGTLCMKLSEVFPASSRRWE